MNPMDFEEFRWALGDEATIPLLQKFWEQKHPLGPAHREMARNLRLYMLVGGMPQAVKAYLDTNNFSKVDIAKRRILNENRPFYYTYCSAVCAVHDGYLHTIE